MKPQDNSSFFLSSDKKINVSCITTKSFVRCVNCVSIDNNSSVAEMLTNLKKRGYQLYGCDNVTSDISNYRIPPTDLVDS